ncbi:MAG: PIN domain-containing protein [Candidatus Kapabacteria bacterium]|nr:PIN domain-containing protein [Candidatus Kapabacteria bacterium]
MMYLLDTVTIIRHFTASKNIGLNAKEILDSIEISDNIFAVSIISLMEMMYLSEKNRINMEIETTVRLLLENDAYKIVDLNTDIIVTASRIKFYELHDRMILAAAKWLDVPILSSDKKFSEVEGIEVIWN